MLLAQLDARGTTRRAGSDDTIGTRFAAEQRVLRPADVAFVAEAATVATISPRALAHVEGAYYSVPCRWAGLDLVTWIGATQVTLVGPDGRRIGQRSIDYRHYLLMLAQEAASGPAGAAGLAPRSGRAVSRALERDAARALAKILGQLEAHGAAVVVPALMRSLAHGTPPWLGLVPATGPPDLPLDAIPITLRVIEIGRGSAADYDTWLGGAA